MCAIIASGPVWTWINYDEEEDTVRLRQRIAFSGFWFITIGALHLRNSITCL